MVSTNESAGSSRSMVSRVLGIGGSSRPPIDSGDTSFRDEMSSLFGSILPLMDERKSIVLHVTASTPGEGTTTIARGLAAAVFRREQCRVLCLEVEPTMRAGGTGSREPTALEQLAATGGIQPVSRMFDGVSVPFGTLMRSANAAPKTQEIRDLYDWARQNFTLTIVDCPPVLSASETAALSRIADGTLLVVHADDTRVAVVRRARDTLEDAGAKILGVILNRRQNFIPSSLYRFL